MIESLKRSDMVMIDGERKGPIYEEVEESLNGFSQLEELYGVVLDPVLVHSHVRYSELGTHWHKAGSSVGAGGEFVLRELVGAVMSGPPDSGSVSRDDERELFNQLRVIDYQPESGVIAFTAVRISGSIISPRVWTYRFPYGLFELDLDYPGYLEKLLLTKGFHGWQFLYADVRLADMKYAPLVQLIRTGVDFLKEALPDPHYAELHTKLAERLK
ncbi:hypothetical protein [Streptomyces sp. NPDC058955]|uniref:hypothetical protein n=1 Tax=unclassified Streptomyces TaxID=2593676 RepID=UPI0036533B52